MGLNEKKNKNQEQVSCLWYTRCANDAILAVDFMDPLYVIEF